MDAEAPGQATLLHSSANVRQCQGEKETFSLRAGMTALIGPTPARPGLRRPASKPAKRKAPGRAWAKPRGAAKLRGPQPPAAGNAPSLSPSGGERAGRERGRSHHGKDGNKRTEAPPQAAPVKTPVEPGRLDHTGLSWGPERPPGKARLRPGE